MDIASLLARSAVNAFRWLPPRERERLKALAGALGHAPGWAQRYRARQLAYTTKRLDKLAPALSVMLREAGVTRIAGLTCMEFGSGHLLSEPILYHIAGAQRSVALDYFPILQMGAVGLACHNVDPGVIVTSLQEFDCASSVRERLGAVISRTDWSLAALGSLGIEYIAPFDAAKGPLEPEAFDLITSLSVLEHVPRCAAEAILANLYAMLTPGGTMIHCIHLEDHRDFDEAPFAFLSSDTDWKDGDDDARGNRLLAPDWERFGRSLPGAIVTVAKRTAREGRLPVELHPQFVRYDPADLLIGWLLLGVKKPLRPMQGFRCVQR